LLNFLFSDLGITLVCFIASIIIIFVIRKTSTKKDDEILDKYVVEGIEFALSIMPANSTVNWIKLAKNALTQFITVYTKTNGELPSKDLIAQAITMIQDAAKKKATQI
jgi:hypothetical protein